MNFQLELFPDLCLRQTPAMAKGSAPSKVWQCAWCGSLVAIPSGTSATPPKREDACPGCGHTDGWWAQRIGEAGVGPFKPADYQPRPPVA